ncbi:MAG: hypothetical protein HOV80_01315 [Polyangiaceae bacterium]|nr:hypothetical protein [Polyangiaceae bacterium]
MGLCASVGCRRPVWIALLLPLTGCWSCDHAADDLVGEMRGDGKAKLVLVESTSPDISPLFGARAEGTFETRNHYELRLELSEKVRHAIRCEPSHVDVSVDLHNDRFAYRCNADEPWWIVFAMPSDRLSPGAAPEHSHIAWSPLFDAEELEGGWVRWERIPSLADAAPRIVLERRPDSERFQDSPATLFSEVERRAGKDRLAEVLAATAKSNLHGDDVRYPDPWLRAYRSLGPSQQEVARAGVVKVLGEKGAGPVPVRRALWVFGPDDRGEWLDDFAARVTEYEADPAYKDPSFQADLGDDVIERLLRVRPEVAGEIACRRRREPSLSDGASLYAIAVTRQPCPVLADHAKAFMKDEEACKSFVWNCIAYGEGGLPCSAEATRSAVMESVPGKRNRRETFFLEAMRATSSPDADLERLIARANYKIDGTCDALENHHARAVALCAAGTSDHGETPKCTFKIDDAKKEIHDVRPK